ncbi:MAG: YjbQ family protein [Candidatus Krumholzibacteriota bacterium]|nr:YjbQ family protein [Candidatus Krumholzibacteriota bacterium]
MKVHEGEHRFETDGDGTIVDLTPAVAGILAESQVTTGQLTVFCPGSTGAVTTIEYEPGLLRDLPALFERIAPEGIGYHHDVAWGDGNGFSHVRAAFLGPSMTVPVSGGEMTLGTWQQIVFLEFDNRPRSRRVTVSVIGV